MKHKKKKINITSFLIVILFLLSLLLIHTIYLFNGIENKLRYITILSLVIFDILFITTLFNKKQRKKKTYRNTILVLAIIIYSFIYVNLNDIYSFLKNLNKDITYSTSLVTLSSNEINDTSLISNEKIGIITDSKETIDNLLSENNLKDNNEIITYSNYSALITALYENEVKYITLPSNYVENYRNTEEFEDIETRTKVITTSKEITKGKEELRLSSNNKSTKEPFSILLMGIDSTTDGFKNSDSFNGDALILLTFNPKTMNATMLTIPRDSYVPISCFPNKEENKITHAAAKGTACMIETVENFLDIKIDYYVKINFTGLVDLVEALGGIEVDVPYNLCEQNSKREFGDKTIYIKKGLQTLNGEQALAFARNRKKNEEFCSSLWTQGYRDDFTRQEHQQTVIRAILDKIKNINDLKAIKNIMSTISKNVDTNMSEDTIFSFYNLGKDVMLRSSNTDIINIIKLYIDGQGQIIYDENTKLNLWNYIPHTESLEEVIKAMKINLEEIQDDTIKNFSFSYGEEYNPKEIGKGPYKTYFTYDLLPNLKDMSLQEAQAWAKKHEIKLNINYVNKSGTPNTIISQNYPYKKRLDKIDNKTVTIEVIKSNQSENTKDKVDCLKDEKNNNCILPNFEGKTKSDIENWASGFSNVINIFYSYEKSEKEEGYVISQSQKEGTTVKELINKSITITFKVAKK